MPIRRASKLQQHLSKIAFQWYGNEYLTQVKFAVDESAFDAAEDLADEIRKNTPRLKDERRQRGPRRRGKYVGQSWTRIEKGLLAKAVKVERSKYRGGGAAVVVGDRDTYYWRWVELGAPKHKSGKYPKQRYIYKSFAKRKRAITKRILAAVGRV